MVPAQEPTVVNFKWLLLDPPHPVTKQHIHKCVEFSTKQHVALFPWNTTYMASTVCDVCVTVL